MTSADNIALETALFAPVTTIRSLAVLRIVDAEETNDYVARLEGAYYVDSTYVGDNDAIITFQVGSTAASTDGVTITLPRDGGDDYGKPSRHHERCYGSDPVAFGGCCLEALRHQHHPRRGL